MWHVFEKKIEVIGVCLSTNPPLYEYIYLLASISIFIFLEFSKSELYIGFVSTRLIVYLLVLSLLSIAALNIFKVCDRIRPHIFRGTMLLDRIS